MPGVAISGYVCGYCIKSGKEEEYGILDLLQFGSKGQRSELVPLLIYDPDIRDWMRKMYVQGKVYPGSFICSIVSIPKTKDTLWIVERVVEFRRKCIVSVDGSGDPPADPGQAGEVGSAGEAGQAG